MDPLETLPGDRQVVSSLRAALSAVPVGNAPERPDYAMLAPSPWRVPLAWGASVAVVVGSLLLAHTAADHRPTSTAVKPPATSGQVGPASAGKGPTRPSVPPVSSGPVAPLVPTAPAVPPAASPSTDDHSHIQPSPTPTHGDDGGGHDGHGS